MTTAPPLRIPQETTDRPALLLAFALGANPWKRGGTPGAAPRPRERNVPARHIEAVREEIRQATQRFGWPAEAPVISGDEAGRDGCWLHRWWVTPGVANCVVDASSLAVQRRHRRAKTDRLEVQQLRTMLLRHAAGERKGGRMGRGPRREAEDRRQRQRAVATAQQDRTRVIHRIQGRRAAHGLVRPAGGAVPQPLEHLRLWDGPPLPVGLRHRLDQAGEHVQALAPRSAQWDAERRAVLRTAEEAVTKKGPQRLLRKGMGLNSAGVCVLECFGGRAFRKRQEVGALRGLTPPPAASGHTAYARGIATAGHPHIRAMAMALAWGGRRLQPESALTQWYPPRLGHGRSRLRRIGMVAWARQLLIALWRLGETGGWPDGAALTGAVRLSPSRR